MRYWSKINNDLNDFVMPIRISYHGKNHYNSIVPNKENLNQLDNKSEKSELFSHSKSIKNEEMKERLDEIKELADYE